MSDTRKSRARAERPGACSFGGAMWELYEGDCLQAMRTRDDRSIDACVTDPPYGLGFMGVGWDTFAERKGIGRSTVGISDKMGQVCNAHDATEQASCRRRENEHLYLFALSWAGEVHHVLKPGGHLLAFGGTRTYHRMACAIEDAGFEIRDCIAWIYGAGFPKSMDLGKAAGAEWQGWGTGLKPAMEPIVVARKPLSESTVAKNVLKWGTGGLNIDACRIPGSAGARIESKPRNGGVFAGLQTRPYIERSLAQGKPSRKTYQTSPAGRFPANLVLDEEAAAMLDGMSGTTTSRASDRNEDKSHTYIYGWAKGGIYKSGVHLGDSGGASRFFYVAKAPSSERWFYCQDCADAFPRADREAHWHGHVNERGEKTWGHLVEHPTVKPLSLMRWLCRLITPPGGTILDPFAGSGTTLLAAVQEGFSVVGIEKEPEYCAIIRRRMAELQTPLPLGQTAT